MDIRCNDFCPEDQPCREKFYFPPCKNSTMMKVKRIERSVKDLDFTLKTGKNKIWIPGFCPRLTKRFHSIRSFVNTLSSMRLCQHRATNSRLESLDYLIFLYFNNFSLQQSEKQSISRRLAGLCAEMALFE